MVAIERTRTEKLLPQNVEAEAGVLGSLLIDPEAIALVSAFLRPDDFYRDAHRLIYEAACDLYEAGEPTDAITLGDELARRGKREEIGGDGYLSALSNQVPTSSNVEYYARIVERTAVLRRLIHAAGQIAGVAYNEPDVRVALQEAERLLQAVTSSYHHPHVLRAVGSALHEYVDALGMALDEQAASGSRRAFLGVPTGFRDLDKLLGGLRLGELLILAARPRVGKSALSLSMALNAAKCGQTVAVFSLEMREAALIQRLLAMESGVDLAHLRDMTLAGDELERVMDAAGRLETLPLYLDDASGLSLSDIRAKVGRLWMERPVDLVIVDYLQLLDSAEAANHYDNRRAQLGEITRGLKRLAGELGVPILALSQLSREIEKRQEKRPMLSDLAESGTIENDADTVLFLHRDEVFNPETERPNIAEVIVAKHRNGDEGQVSLYFQKSQTRYRDLELYDHTPATAPNSSGSWQRYEED